MVRLERTEAVTGTPSLMDQLEPTLNASAVRLTGRPFGSLSNEEAAFELVLEDLQASFTRNLSDDDLKSLIWDLELIAAGDDPTVGTRRQE